MDIEELDFLPGERREIAMEIDRQKQKMDPSFKGAFHERKKKSEKKKKSRR